MGLGPIGGDPDGLLRIVHTRGSRRVVGVHVLVEGAADLMGEAALAVRLGTTVDELAEAIHPHPTLTASVLPRSRLAADRCRQYSARSSNANQASIGASAPGIRCSTTAIGQVERSRASSS